MAIRTYDILLDSYNSTMPEPIVGRQGDKNGAVTLHVTITDRGTAVDLTGKTVNLIAETANGTAVVADNAGVTLTDAPNGKFDYAIPNALWSESGKITKAYFSLNDNDGHETTYDLIFMVKAAVDVTQEKADDYITVIDGTIRDLKTKLDDYIAVIDGTVRDLQSKVDAIYATYQAGDFYSKAQTDEKYAATLASVNDLQSSVDQLRQHKPLTDKMGIEDADNTNSQSFDYLGKVGFKYCRVLVHFENTVKADGTYNWNDTDSFIDGTLAAGMIPVVTIGTGLGVFGSYSDALAAMPGYLSALVQRYAGKGVVWEAFNEPYYTFLGSSGSSNQVISDWVAMSKLLGQYVVKYDPAATYLTGSFTANADYPTEKDEYALWGQTMRQAFQQGLLDYASAVSYHPYQINTAPESLLATTGFNQAAHRVDNLLNQYSRGRVKSVITEFGYSTSNPGLITLTEQQQAQWLARSMFVFDLLDVPIIILFRDVGHKVGTAEEAGVTSTAKQEYGFGLFNSDGGTDPYRGLRITGDRPSGALVRSLLGELKDYVLQGRLSTVSAGDFCLIYQLGNSKKMVYWTTGDSHSVVIDGQTINLTATPQVMAWVETDIEFVQHTSEMPGSRWVGQKTIQLTADTGNHIASGALVLTFIDLADTILVDVTSYLSSVDPTRAGTFTDTKLPLPDANSAVPFALVGAGNQTIIRYGMIRSDGTIGSWISAPATYDAGTDFSIHFSYTSRDALTSLKNYI